MAGLPQDPGHPHPSPLRWLLLVPFVAVMWVPFYNGVTPTILSVPLFYWYQLAWVVLCSLIIGAVFLIEHRRPGPRG